MDSKTYTQDQMDRARDLYVTLLVAPQQAHYDIVLNSRPYKPYGNDKTRARHLKQARKELDAAIADARRIFDSIVDPQ